MIGVAIKAIEFSLPKKKENFKELLKDNPLWDTDKIFKATGINSRYVSNEKENVISLSVKSAKKILKKFPKSKIDFLIFVTQTSDYKLPSASCVMQNLLGLKENIKAFDINMGCSGFIYALNIANNIIRNNEGKNGLIICSDVYTKFIKKNNRSCRPIFSDASCSIIVSKTIKNSIENFVFGTDGSGYHDLILKNKSEDLFMNGSRVALFSIKRVPQSIRDLLNKNKMKINEVDKFIFHQASKYVLNQIYRVLRLNKKKIFENYMNYGNTVSASIPIALKMADNKKFLKSNDRLILSGFGVGLSWGSALLRWKKII